MLVTFLCGVCVCASARINGILCNIYIASNCQALFILLRCHAVVVGVVGVVGGCALILCRSLNLVVVITASFYSILFDSNGIVRFENHNRKQSLGYPNKILICCTNETYFEFSISLLMVVNDMRKYARDPEPE